MRPPEPWQFEVIPLADGDFRIVSPIRRADGQQVAFYLDCAQDGQGLLTDRGETLRGLRVMAADKERIKRLIAPATIGPAGVIRLRLSWERIQARTLFPFARSLATLAILTSAQRATAASSQNPSSRPLPVRTRIDSCSDAEPKRASSAPIARGRQPRRPFTKPVSLN